MVTALQRPASQGEGNKWLLVKRPEEGLLAGQWEFPHAVVGMHKDTLPDDPGAPFRSNTANELVDSIGVTVTANAGLVQLPEPIEHIFSHIRHTMHIEHSLLNVKVENDEDTVWLREGREYSWMDATRMRQVGVTAGVKKVIASVTGSSEKSKSKGTKRKKVSSGAELKQQPRISTFFSK